MIPQLTLAIRAAQALSEITRSEKKAEELADELSHTEEVKIVSERLKSLRGKRQQTPNMEFHTEKEQFLSLIHAGKYPASLTTSYTAFDTSKQSPEIVEWNKQVEDRKKAKREAKLKEKQNGN